MSTLVRSVRRVLVVVVALSAGMLPLGATAQPCEPQWLPLGGVNDQVATLLWWDPDGAGPAPPGLVVGGFFTAAGAAPADFIAMWDPATASWSALGEGTDGPVYALAAMPNGDLVAGGLFGQAGEARSTSVARWDGSRWHSMGGGVSGSIWPARAPAVSALAALPGGDIVAGGSFTHAGGVEAYGIAQWDGDGWRALGVGAGIVRDLAGLASGELAVGGYHTIATWDGERWARFPATTGSSPHDPYGVNKVAPHPSGGLIAGGNFTAAGEVSGTGGIARWDGVGWQSMGGGLPLGTAVHALAIRSSGDLVVGGRFQSVGGVEANRIARWDGSAWSALGDGVDASVYALAELPGGDLVVGGRFAKAGGLDSPYLAIWRDCPECYADCDGSGSLEFFDFLCFQTLFAAMHPAADCDGDGEFSFFDFLCFQNAFAAGCE